MPRTKRKNQIRALADKTGKRPRGAANLLPRPTASLPNAAVPPVRTPIERLVADLAPFHVSAILVGRLPAGGASASAAHAAAQARERALNPQYFAETASVEQLISLDEMGALLAAGATQKNGRQNIVLPLGATDCSIPCAHCRGWIWCGSTERGGQCDCGAAYVVSFGADSERPLPRGRRCMKCGDREGHALQPLHHLNESQWACDACGHMSHVDPWWVEKAVHDRTSTPVTGAQLTADVDLEVDELVRAYGGVPDGYLVQVKYNPARGKSLDDAVQAVRGLRARRPELLSAVIRRTDRPGHPLVCEWKRRTRESTWTFTWRHGSDDVDLEPLALD